jgi:hypothetical protein
MHLSPKFLVGLLLLCWKVSPAWSQFPESPLGQPWDTYLHLSGVSEPEAFREILRKGRVSGGVGYAACALESAPVELVFPAGTTSRQALDVLIDVTKNRWRWEIEGNSANVFHSSGTPKLLDLKIDLDLSNAYRLGEALELFRKVPALQQGVEALGLLNLTPDSGIGLANLYGVRDAEKAVRLNLSDVPFKSALNRIAEVFGFAV